MARTGVTFADVSAAADQLLHAGERPSTERVRVALGRGSPNTIGPLLEQWWGKLAQRLAQQVALPQVPDAVAAAFAQAWQAALAAGHAHGEAQVAPERAALAEVLAKADAAVAGARDAYTALERQLTQARGEATAHQAALAISDQRNSDLHRQIGAQQTELQALGVRLDATLARHHLVVQQAEDARAAAAAEREALQAHARQVEDRAYGEVDRVRQELKALKAQVATQTREHAAAVRTSEQHRRSAEAALAAAQRTAPRAARRAATPTKKAAKPSAPRRPRARPTKA